MDAVIYVGLTLDPHARLAQHIKVGLCARVARVVEFSWHDDLAEARRAETAAIQAFRPPRNIRDNRMQEALARKIWHSDPYASNDAILLQMPGWKQWTARIKFGPRIRRH